MKIITVSREFGSGGRELGKRLADELGFAYYDKEIITAIAEEEGLSEEYVERVLETPSAFGYTVTYSRSFFNLQNFNATPQLLAKQHNLIKKIAQKGNCVIVGRGADAILSEYSPFKIFVHADMPSKIDRCIERGRPGEELSERELKRKIHRVDKARSENYSFVSDYSWGDKAAYDLCVNTTGLEIKKIVPHIAAYAEAWFQTKEK